MGFIERLNWRYATKKYSGKKVAREDFDKILEAIRMAPSSAGAQPFHVVVVSDTELKDTLFESSGQVAKKNCAYLLVFCTRLDYPSRADAIVRIAAEAQGKTVEELSGFAGTVGSATDKPREELHAWASKQTYIALGFGLAAAAELSVDSSPMEGFEPEEYARILGLPDYIRPVVLMAIGYRDPEDPAQPENRAKARFPKEDLFDFR